MTPNAGAAAAAALASPQTDTAERKAGAGEGGRNINSRFERAAHSPPLPSLPEKPEKPLVSAMASKCLRRPNHWWYQDRWQLACNWLHAGSRPIPYRFAPRTASFFSSRTGDCFPIERRAATLMFLCDPRLLAASPPAELACYPRPSSPTRLGRVQHSPFDSYCTTEPRQALHTPRPCTGTPSRACLSYPDLAASLPPPPPQ